MRVNTKRPEDDNSQSAEANEKSDENSLSKGKETLDPPETENTPSDSTSGEEFMQREEEEREEGGRRFRASRKRKWKRNKEENHNRNERINRLSDSSRGKNRLTIYRVFITTGIQRQVDRIPKEEGNIQECDV